MACEQMAKRQAPTVAEARARCRTLAALAAAIVAWPASLAAQPPPARELRIDVVYDNVPHAPGFTTGWGFSCLVRGLGETLLFDTGADGTVLLSNLARLGVDPRDIDAVVLSHAHGDHTGGLRALLERNSELRVYLLASFPEALVRAARGRGAQVVFVDRPRELIAGAHATGPIRDDPDEQALVVETAEGLVVVTGCAHPGIERVVHRVVELHSGPIALLLGGMHLRGADAARLRRVVAALATAPVRRLAPSHCTGDAATAELRRQWGPRFVESGCGARFLLPLARRP